MSSLPERRTYGVLLIVFAVAQYRITCEHVFGSFLPYSWLSLISTGRPDAIARETTFPQTMFLVAGPLISLLVGAALSMFRTVTTRVWLLEEIGLAGILALGFTMVDWQAALYAPLMIAYSLSLAYVTARCRPTPALRRRSTGIAA
jgi:hypothetical protein